MLLPGPPGSGKTLLARSMPSTPSVSRARWHGCAAAQGASVGPTQVRDHCPVDETGRQHLGAAMQRLRPGDEPERAGVHRHLRWRASPVQVSPGAEAGSHDCGFGWEQADSAGVYHDVDPGSTAIQYRPRRQE